MSKVKPGIAVISLETKKVLYVDTYPSNEKNMYYRFLEIKYWLEDIITTFRPEVIMIEKEFIKTNRFGSNATIPLLKLHGYVLFLIKSFGLPMYEILPTSARAFLKIKPNTKEEAFNYIKKNFDELQLKEFKNDNDIADAIITALNYLNEKKKEVC